MSLLVVGLSNTNSLVMDMPTAYTVIIYKGLYRVLYNARSPNIAGWC